jgi:hypothetical protein
MALWGVDLDQTNYYLKLSLIKVYFTMASLRDFTSFHTEKKNAKPSEPNES